MHRNYDSCPQTHPSSYKKKPLKISGFLSGKAGIRTLGTRKGTTVFETAPIDHSGISPRDKSYYRFATAKLIIFFYMQKSLLLFLMTICKNLSSRYCLCSGVYCRFERKTLSHKSISKSTTTARQIFSPGCLARVSRDYSTAFLLTKLLLDCLVHGVLIASARVHEPCSVFASVRRSI